MKKTLKIILSSITALVLLVFPYCVSAAPKNFKELIDKIFLPIIDQGTKVLIAVAVLIFFWNIAISLFGERSAEKNKKLRDALVWGLIAIFVMVSIWGILYILRKTLMQGL